MMKKPLLLAAILVLTGCFETTPIKRNFPEIPHELTQTCPDLKLIDQSTTKLSTVIGVVSENYGQYHECKTKVEAWIEWYKEQKEIFDSVDISFDVRNQDCVEEAV